MTIFKIVASRQSGPMVKNRSVYVILIFFLSCVGSLSSKTGSSFLEDSLGNNGQSQKMLETIQDFDEKFRNHRPQHDKSMLKRAMCISTLRVSWNLIEAEICHNPGKNSYTVRPHMIPTFQ